MANDRMPRLWFLGFSLGDRVPDENTIRHFHNRLVATGLMDRLPGIFDAHLQERLYSDGSDHIACMDAGCVPEVAQHRGSECGEQG